MTMQTPDGTATASRDGSSASMRYQTDDGQVVKRATQHGLSVGHEYNRGDQTSAQQAKLVRSLRNGSHPAANGKRMTGPEIREMTGIPESTQSFLARKR
ncbi:hypothetical protein GAY28_13845 [Azospirillum brasilense]|nr:hypothetical protein [Azospirillum brasilense]